MAARKLASDPFVQLAVGAAAISIPYLADALFGLDLQSFLPATVDLNTALPIIVLAFLLALNVGRTTLRNALKPRAFHAAEVSYLYTFTDCGDFEGSITTEVENRSGREISRVPSESLMWNEEIGDADIFFEIVYKEGDRPHAFRDSSYDVVPEHLAIDRMRKKRPYTAIAWSPEIEPPLEKGGCLTYEVLVKTPATEMEAFGDSGTTLGFPVSMPTRRVRLVAKAPFGFAFRLMAPPYEVIDMTSGLPVPLPEDLAPPTLMGGGSTLEWIVRNPQEKRRYWIHYRFYRRNIR